MIEWAQGIHCLFIVGAGALAALCIGYGAKKAEDNADLVDDPKSWLITSFKPTGFQVLMSGIYLLVFALVVGVLKIVAQFG